MKKLAISPWAVGLTHVTTKTGAITDRDLIGAGLNLLKM